MRGFPLKLEKSLEKRKQEKAFRSLGIPGKLIDFSSNDYLGFANSSTILERAGEILANEDLLGNGATGSRLLTGNHVLYDKAEIFLARFHQAEAALIFNSGYDANLGFFSAVPGRGDFIVYDEYSHASVRDGIRMSAAKSYKFLHNDITDLKRKIDKIKKNDRVNASGEEMRKLSSPVIYVITESVFSMDGDIPDLKAMIALAEEIGFFLIVDEAHATGVFGQKGEGLVQELGLQEKVFARIATFGKALGSHGAVVLGDQRLKEFLVNFARSFIYTTALPPHVVATILAAYEELENRTEEIIELNEKIEFFRKEIIKNGLENNFIKSASAIQSCVIPGNEKVKQIAEKISTCGFEVKAILSPTVPAGKERLRFCLHSYNSKDEIRRILNLLATFRL